MLSFPSQNDIKIFVGAARCTRNQHIFKSGLKKYFYCDPITRRVANQGQRDTFYKVKQTDSAIQFRHSKAETLIFVKGLWVQFLMEMELRRGYLQ